MAVSQMIGASIKRREDPRLVTGTGSYVDDIPQTAVVHMHVVRSTEAHARILSIETGRAREADGVLAVFTGKDLKSEFNAPLPVTVCFVPDKKYPNHYPIAVDKVLYAGEPVAIVLATSRAAAEDAGERIDIRYESLSPVLDIEKAIEKDAPVLHEEIGSNLSFDVKFASGDIEAAFREADVKIKQRLIQQRLIPVAVEGRGVLADYKPFTNKLTVYTSTQIPHFVKVWLAVILGISESNVRVVAPEVGGGFGSKIRVYPEEILTALASRRIGRPVKWIEDRNENVKATHHGRSQIWDVEIAAKKDGTLLGIRPTQWLDLGAYCSQFGTFQVLGVLVAQGAYKMKAFDGRSVGVFTNRTPTDAYRGAGRPEATYLIERVMDLIARETGLDPVEVRRKNFVRAEDQPFTTLLGLTYDSGDYTITLDKALEMVDYKGFRKEQAEKRKQGKYLGIGLATYIEICGLGPAAATQAATGVSLWGMSVVNLHFTGKATVIIGSSPHGQGHETTYAQVASDVLGIPVEDIDVVHGDTAIGPMGMNTYGSRSTALDGNAVHLSAMKVQEKAKKIAAHLLEAAEADVVYENGKAFVKGTPSKSITIQEIAMAAFQTNRIPKGMEGGLEATTFFDPSNFVWPFGAHIAVVEVDADTGATKILRYVAVDDCGTRINPMVVDGQLHGGIAQGIGQALFEEAVYDEAGQLRSGSLTDYLIPAAPDVPSFELAATVTPSPVNPLGTKGIGEAGTIASSVTVINAIVDALAPFGVKDVIMPATPDKIWHLMHRNGGSNR
ncbi:MAG: xanthine dehydrogenase family protein molybdopterin-binding subunit [Chloroflexi bacterium]|nr:MAG: xanthine dehydrogenase family protein molybdopterin-binding subunit [Chloroflexota bacterium]TME46817.1 MAG: xanthine dehydrogenase family protein molybdopterin-binding subunit [Chloroflexota bacterium]